MDHVLFWYPIDESMHFVLVSHSWDHVSSRVLILKRNVQSQNSQKVEPPLLLKWSQHSHTEKY